MTSSAQVRSVEAIEQFRAQLAKYEQQVQSALETLSSEVRRAADWVAHDRPSYWKRETKLAEDMVQQAKLDLERCLIFPIAGEQPSCREERAALKKAQQRVDDCREKSERARHWKRQLHHEIFEFEGRIGHLKRILETELPAARARLQQIVAHLDSYQIERPRAATPSPSQASSQTPSQEPSQAPTGEA